MNLLEQERRRKSYCGVKMLLISLGIHMEEAWNETLRKIVELFNYSKWESIDKELLAACEELK